MAGFSAPRCIANDLDAVLDAAAELQRRGRTDIKLVMIGDGNQKDRLVGRAKTEGLCNCLFFPPVKKTGIARVSASFDCGLQILADVPAFYRGTSPNKFFDYISSGIPVVNNYPGWLADLIQTHRCGIAAPPKDATALADALCALADNPEGGRVMGEAARRLTIEQFGRQELASAVCGAARAHGSWRSIDISRFIFTAGFNQRSPRQQRRPPPRLIGTCHKLIEANGLS